MKRLLFSTNVACLLLLFLSAGDGWAQTHEFAPVGAEWYYGFGDFFTYGYQHVMVEKDTVVDDVDCVKLVKWNYVYNQLTQTLNDYKQGLNEYVACVDNKVYLYGEQGFQLWFDFDAEVGDSWPLPSHYYELTSGGNAGSVVVEAKGTMWVNGLELKYIDIIDREGSEYGYGWYHLGGGVPYTVRVCERIGPLGCYLFPVSHVNEDENEGGALRCYQDETIGHVSYYSNNCDYINTEYQDVEELPEDDAVVICPNPASTWAVVDYKLPADKTEAVVEIYNSLGAKVMSVELVGSQGQRVLDFRHLPGGVYTYNLRSGEFVKTGKIVITTVH